MYHFTLKPLPTVDHWRNLAEYWHLSARAKERLEWLIFYHTIGKRNALQTARYFGIAPKTFHKWKKRFDPHRIQSLEEHSRAPKRRRTPEVTKQEEERIRKLRTAHLQYGKQKIKRLYLLEHNENISTWKIQRVIREHQLYPDPLEHKKKLSRNKLRHHQARKRIQQVGKEYTGTLWHTDSVTIWWFGERRVVFTAIHDKTKLGFAHIYLNNTSRKATDFLKRLVYLTDGDITIIHHDNGSEFAGEFEQACKVLNIEQVYSRVRQPKDNAALERFNRTVQEEWLEMSEIGLFDIEEANRDLTEWLIEYNAYRPHQSLDYQTPLSYAYQTKVLPMTPASTSSIDGWYTNVVSCFTVR